MFIKILLEMSKNYMQVVMKQISVIVFLMLFTANAFSQNNGIYVNVKDFGAKGDGQTDDTRAILQAFAFVASNQMSFQGIAGVYDKNAIYAGGSKIIYFPLGLYRVSKPLQLGLSYVHITGEKAVLSPTA